MAFAAAGNSYIQIQQEQITCPLSLLTRSEFALLFFVICTKKRKSKLVSYIVIRRVFFSIFPCFLGRRCVEICRVVWCVGTGQSLGLCIYILSLLGKQKTDTLDCGLLACREPRGLLDGAEAKLGKLLFLYSFPHIF